MGEDRGGEGRRDGGIVLTVLYCFVVFLPFRFQCFVFAGSGFVFVGGGRFCERMGAGSLLAFQGRVDTLSWAVQTAAVCIRHETPLWPMPFVAFQIPSGQYAAIGYVTDNFMFRQRALSSNIIRLSICRSLATLKLIRLAKSCQEFESKMIYTDYQLSISSTQ